MIKKLFLLSLIVFFSLLLWTNSAKAGFGISPPYVKSDRIIPGTRYEQVINLLRSSAEDELQAEITLNAPEMESWITINKGLSFVLPKDQLQVPMIVAVNVPVNAAVGEYTGYLNVRIAPKGMIQGAVGIALGARIDIDLNVTKENIADFTIKEVSISDIELLKAPWKWPIFSWFIYRLNLNMKIENTGNIDVSPSKAHIDIYDLNERNLLESGDSSAIKKIKPFQTATVIASYPTGLKAGQYWAKIKIYKDEQIIRDDKVIFTVWPAGQLPGGQPIGVWPWVILVGLIILSIVAIGILIKIKIWRLLIKLIWLLLWPLRFAAGKFIIFFNNQKIKFWKWMHKKASRYQDHDSNFRKK
jgi:hypothetical protein